MRIKYLLLCLLASCGMTVDAQQETYDLITYQQPAGWTKKEHPNAIHLNTPATKQQYFTTVMLFKSIVTSFDAQQNFTDCWNNILKKTVTVKDAPKMGEPVESEGWKIVSGSAAYTDGKDKGGAMQLTATGYGRRINILLFSNTFLNQKAIDTLFASIHFNKPAGEANDQASTNTPPVTSAPAAAAQPKSSITGYKFTTTNFDNGWTATQQADWVQLNKGGLTALLHYPDEITEKYYPYPTDAVKANWDHLVANRYTSISNFNIYTQSTAVYRPAKMAAANVQDKASGKNLYVVLFQRDKSYWTEFIAADKNAFVQAMGINVDALESMAENNTFDPLAALSDMNRFAVAASDLTGTWTSQSAGGIAYVSVYSGAYAGGTVAGVNNEYHFLSGNQYTSTHNGGYGTVGNVTTYKKNYKGSSTVTAWSIALTNREKGATEKFDAIFVGVKGGRLLVLKSAEGNVTTLGKMAK